MPFDGFVQWTPDPEITVARRPLELPTAKKRSAHRNNFRQQAIFAALFLLFLLGSAFTFVIVSSIGAQNVRLEKTPEEKRGAFFFSQQSAGALKGNALLRGKPASGKAVVEYVWMGTFPLVQIDSSGNIFSIHSDQVNNPQKITNASRTLVWDREQEPFGETYATPTNTTPTNLRFPGQYADVENLLSYNLMRDYDNTLGRYGEFDPSGLRGGLNGFGYASQNPTERIDPLGLSDDPNLDIAMRQVGHQWDNPDTPAQKTEDCESMYGASCKLFLDNPLADMTPEAWAGFGLCEASVLLACHVAIPQPCDNNSTKTGAAPSAPSSPNAPSGGSGN